MPKEANSLKKVTQPAFATAKWYLELRAVSQLDQEHPGALAFRSFDPPNLTIRDGNPLLIKEVYTLVCKIDGAPSMLLWIPVGAYKLFLAEKFCRSIVNLFRILGEAKIRQMPEAAICSDFHGNLH